MDLVALDEQRQLFISPSIDDWKLIEDHGITAVIDLSEGRYVANVVGGKLTRYSGER
jgi:hypothetical protein